MLGSGPGSLDVVRLARMKRLGPGLSFLEVVGLAAMKGPEVGVKPVQLEAGRRPFLDRLRMRVAEAMDHEIWHYGEDAERTRQVGLGQT